MVNTHFTIGFGKNKLNSISSNSWFGFCAYRRFWTNSLNKTEIKSKKDFLHSIPKEWDDYDVILGQNIYMDRWTIMKILKHGFKSFVLNPKYFLKK